MLTFVLRRLAYSIPVLIVATILVFWFVRTTTDPLARLRLGSRDPTLIQRETTRLGLDKPLFPVHFDGVKPQFSSESQYGRFVSDFVRGDWGQSFISRREVKDMIRGALWNTVQLIFWGIVLSAVTAMAVGVYSASRQYSALDHTFTGLSFFGLSMPAFFFGLMAIQLLSYQLKVWFDWEDPLFFSVGAHSVDPVPFDYLRHLALPVMTLSVQIVAGWSRYQRASMLDVMHSDYIRTARAKGVPPGKVLVKHGLRNALIPLVTVMAIDIGALFGGLIITEQIFSWPGMGKIFLDALLNGDTAVIMPWMVVVAGFIIVFNLLADVVYGVLDPRVRLT